MIPMASRTLTVLSVSGFALAGIASAGTTMARAAVADLRLEHGKVFTNDVGSVMAVSIVNGTTSTVGSAVVTCSFTANGQPVGSADTTIFNIVAGEKGQDQVHLMGPKADAATCSITSTTPAGN